MTLTITIEMDNAAFEENAGSEVSRILTKLAEDYDGRDLLPDADASRPLRDLNGNNVGTAKVTD